LTPAIAGYPVRLVAPHVTPARRHGMVVVLAVRAKLAGIAEVSDVTLLNRLPQSEGWLRELCQQLWLNEFIRYKQSLS
jgi:hypothetical protein